VTSTNEDMHMASLGKYEFDGSSCSGSLFYFKARVSCHPFLTNFWWNWLWVSDEMRFCTQNYITLRIVTASLYCRA